MLELLEGIRIILGEITLSARGAGRVIRQDDFWAGIVAG
jgi:hypothetical protein